MKLQPVSEMEHFTSSEFLDQFDVLIDKVSKDQVGIVIEHEGRSCVLCPAEWFSPLDRGTVDDEKLITVGRKVLEQYREAFIKLGKNEE